jgi:hypothetical protein
MGADKKDPANVKLKCITFPGRGQFSYAPSNLSDSETLGKRFRVPHMKEDITGLLPGYYTGLIRVQSRSCCYFSAALLQ